MRMESSRRKKETIRRATPVIPIIKVVLWSEDASVGEDDVLVGAEEIVQFVYPNERRRQSSSRITIALR